MGPTRDRTIRLIGQGEDSIEDILDQIDLVSSTERRCGILATIARSGVALSTG